MVQTLFSGRVPQVGAKRARSRARFRTATARQWWSCRRWAYGWCRGLRKPCRPKGVTSDTSTDAVGAWGRGLLQASWVGRPAKRTNWKLPGGGIQFVGVVTANPTGLAARFCCAEGATATSAKQQQRNAAGCGGEEGRATERRHFLSRRRRCNGWFCRRNWFSRLGVEAWGPSLGGFADGDSVTAGKRAPKSKGDKRFFKGFRRFRPEVNLLPFPKLETN